MIIFPTDLILCDLYFPQVEENEMSRPFSTNGGRRGSRIDYWWESQRERVHYEDQDVGGWIILGWIFERWGGGGEDWIGLAEDRNRRRALVNSVLNLRVP
jgi:hypothetical protein